MHGREGEETKRKRRHMRPGLATATSPVASSADSPSASSVTIATDSFCKDGRKIRVGDCALFQGRDSQPFIGIIRWLTSCKEIPLKLGVNWLYRPADITLGKGISLEAAPNEVFYSFHRDEIPAASLLHPCKVAFLRKGVELPPGLSSFVCRRVYDVENHCLWWLTDQDYINERQEEVDQLLDKTRLEMHAAVQSGGRSPKPLNGPTSTAQQLKPGSDSVQNSTTLFPSQGNKGKKRERGGDQGSDPVKRERSLKADDGDSSNFRQESMIKAEIAKITDKGGLINTEGVEKLVHLMQLDRAEKKIDMGGRIMLADVVAATDKLDCLDRFVELRGVPVLDDWLQEAHKGKVGDNSSPKESDKSVEELLLALLRALDKLPVNLHALQTCNVGKSVNHLRSHKNLDIQRKARSLVDTWKKRVEAEMKIIEAKSGSSHQAVSWPGKPGGYSEVSHSGGNRRAGPYEVALKGYIMQTSAAKTAGSMKLGHGDAVAKPTSVSTGSVKLAPALPASAALSSKDSYCKMAGGSGISDIPPSTATKEEKSSSSSQSQNNSQSCSSDHTKAVASAWKEDARSSTAGSISAKTSTSASRTRRSSNGVPGSGISGVQKESALGKPSTSNRNSTPDKASQSGVTCERMLDMPLGDHGNSHRLIVRLPNPGRSPARSASGGSFDDPPVVGSRASSPGASEKQDNSDRRAKGKSDNCQAVSTAADVNTESWQSNDVKDGLAGYDEGDRSPAAVGDEERSRNTDEIVKSIDMSKGPFASPRTGKGDFSSINALIESCVKYSEASASLSAGDDLGMNLLASVAAGEMSKSDLVSPAASPDRNAPAPDDSHIGNNTRSRLLQDDSGAQAHGKPDDDSDALKQGTSVEPIQLKDGLQVSSTNVMVNTSGDSKCVLPLPEHKPTIEQSEQLPPPSTEASEPSVKSDMKPEEMAPTVRVPESTVLPRSEAPPAGVKEGPEVERSNQRPKRRKANVGRSTDYKPRLRSASLDQNKVVDHASEKVAHNNLTAPSKSLRGDGRDIDQVASSVKETKEEAVEETPSCPALKKGSESLDRVHEGLTGSISSEQKLAPAASNHIDASERSGDHASAPCSSSTAPCPDSVDESNKAEKADGMETKKLGVSEMTEQTAAAPPTLDERAAGNADVGVLDHSSRVEENSDRKEVVERCPTVPTEQCQKSTEPKLAGSEADERQESTSANAAGSDLAAKLDFDLNEGFPVEDGNQGELGTSSTAPGSASAVHLLNPMPFSVSPMSSSLPTSITVAAAARGAFVHPENPLRSKGELGWKGSASTSAFRPAEPRKILEMPLNTIDVPPSDSHAGKQTRPALDIDLNVPDERVVEDMASQSLVRETGSESRGPSSNRDLGRSEMFSSPAAFRSAGLDLDLNRVDETADNGQFLASTSRRMEVPLLPARSSSSSGFLNGEMNALRDFDLNNGPGLDEVGADAAPRNQHVKSSGPFLPPHVASLRMNNTELGNLSWFSPGPSYPAATIPSFLSDRGADQPYPMVPTAAGQRILGSATAGTFGGDIYRGPVLSSSPAMAFSPATAFPYTGFPFGTSFPLASTSFSGAPATYIDSSSGGSCFPTIPSQLVGPTGAVSSHYPRPYVISLPESNATSSSGGGAESSRKWGRQGLDLNAGPGSTDVEGRDERLLPSVPRQLSVANSQALAEEQARIYQQAAAAAAVGGGGVLKRKEPDGGGWDGDRFSGYKQSSWHQ